MAQQHAAVEKKEFRVRPATAEDCEELVRLGKVGHLFLACTTYIRHNINGFTTAFAVCIWSHWQDEDGGLLQLPLA